MANESGQTVVEEFMLSRSAGRLHLSDIYQETESILLEIAEDQGKRDLVKGWLRNPGYVPESLLYAIFGWPESMRLRA